MKNICFISLLLITHYSFSQAPSINWQKVIGGTLADNLYSINQTSDGGFIFGGSSLSGATGNKTEASLGLEDYWIVKLDVDGDIEWQNTIGGMYIDILKSVEQTNDGGYILGGRSSSNISGDKTENSLGGTDYWIIKLNSSGSIEWQNTIGGNGDDILNQIHQTYDGGYIIAGYSASDSTVDKTENSIGGTDFWVVKLDSSGDIEWQNTIGGTLNDGLAVDIQQTFEGGYILGGASLSGVSGDKTESSIGGYDYWVVKLSNSGEIIWQNTIGGSSSDVLTCLDQTNYGEYILGGYSSSGVSGDKTEANIGGYDYWVVKLNSIGGIEWQNTIGGSDEDEIFAIQQTFSRGFVMGGYSKSGISGDKTAASFGQNDYWLVKIDSMGIIKWQKTMGGTLTDNLYSLTRTTEGGYALGGHSTSGISGTKNLDSIGGGDYWIIKLFPEFCLTNFTFYEDADGDGFGNILVTVSACVPPTGYVTNSLDCDDTNAANNPGASEMCNELDDNCNFLIDEDLPLNIYFFDNDGDGYGDLDSIINTCYISPPAGYSIDSTDCDDDDDLFLGPSYFFADIDGDGYGDVTQGTIECFAPVGFVEIGTDCDDDNPDINPGATEVCNSVDDNCNLSIDEGLPLITLYIDADDDNFGNPLTDTTSCYVEIIGYVDDSTDCDDTNILINPSVTEICNEIDDNCNDEIDEGLSFTLYIDDDDDGFGNILSDTTSCSDEITGYVNDSTDCDDTNPDVFPGADEILNGIDDNCNDLIDEGLSVIENSISASFEIYPNPNNGNFEITIQNFNSNNLTIEIFNLQGEIIYATQFNHEEHFIINIPSSFSGAMYVVMNDETHSISKLINVIR